MSVTVSEQRALKGNCELREGPNGPMIVGYAAVFNSDSEDLGGFIEQIDPSAFNRTVQQADVRGLGNHDANWLLGRTKSGTCRLTVDTKGLFYEIDVNTVDPDGQRALAKVQRGDWDGSSFAFRCIRDEWDWDAAPPRRRVMEAALVDVGPVSFPAYSASTAAARALHPLAAKLGRTPDELAAALRSGEIRSLLEPPGDEEETRVGKMISAANAEKLRAAIDAISSLLQGETHGGAAGEANSLDDEDGDETPCVEENSAPLDAEERTVPVAVTEAMLRVRDRQFRYLNAA